MRLLAVALLGIFFFIQCRSKPETAAEELPRNPPVHEGENIAIALEPGSNRIAIDLQGKIWSFPAKGGRARLLTPSLNTCYEPTWSPDGNYVAFHAATDGFYHLWTVKADGTELKQITFGEVNDKEPHWSPKGHEIIFTSDRQGNLDIWKVTLQNGFTEPLTIAKADDYFPSYSPEGNDITFVSERQGNYGLYRTHLIKYGTLLPELIHASDNPILSPSWHPGNKGISYCLSRDQSFHHFFWQEDANRQLTSKEEVVYPYRIAWQSDTSFLYTADKSVKQRVLGEDRVNIINFTAITTDKPASENSGAALSNISK